MFGLFQAELPIGNRLWYTLLAIVIAGSIAATPIANALSDPVSFAIYLLLLYAQATMLSTFAMAILLVPMMIIEFQIKRRVDEGLPTFFKDTEDYSPLWDRIFYFLLFVAYIVAVIWIAQGRYSSTVGVFSLILILLAEIWTEWGNINLIGHEYVELHWTSRSKNINGKIISSEIEKEYKIASKWENIIVHLGDNGWEILELRNNFVFLSRKYKKGILPEQWLIMMPNWVKRVFERRPIRNRI